MHSFMQHIWLQQTCTESLRSYCCQISAQSHKERKKTMISIPWLVIQGLHYSAAALMVLAALQCAHSSQLNILKHSSLQWGVQPLTSGTYVSVSLSVTFCPHSLSVYFSRCHIMSLSLTGHVATCMLRSGPSVCQGEGGICWVKWTEASGNWFHLRVFWAQHKEKRPQSLIQWLWYKRAGLLLAKRWCQIKTTKALKYNVFWIKTSHHLTSSNLHVCYTCFATSWEEVLPFFNLRVGGLIPSSSCPHVIVSLDHPDAPNLHDQWRGRYLIW